MQGFSPEHGCRLVTLSSAARPPAWGRGQDARLRGVMGEPGQAGTSKASTGNARGDPKINRPFATCTCRGAASVIRRRQRQAPGFWIRDQSNYPLTATTSLGLQAPFSWRGDATGQVFARLCRAGGPAGRGAGPGAPAGVGRAGFAHVQM